MPNTGTYGQEGRKGGRELEEAATLQVLHKKRCILQNLQEKNNERC